MDCMDPSLSYRQEAARRKQNQNQRPRSSTLKLLKGSPCREESSRKMRSRTVLALLVAAFVGWNLLLGASVKPSDPAYGTVELNARKLKESRYTLTNRETRSLQDIGTDDYQPVDPSPSSKASIRPGPIEHGAPLFPYVPGYPPPAQAPASPGS